ncbi:unnamed protein product [Paramecium sonneborni]|uniref:Transmembrane protein n=1 Tax=Paramecium sonneborni TaxID=65129 RepID=A0A8S1L5L9_9CILI|nr:unnamed protein product [Paramecium sonneborni]
MIIIYIYFLNSLVFGLPNERQRKVIEDLKREDTLFDFHPNEKLNNKMKIGPYPQDQIDCKQVSICKNCKSNEAYLITTKNAHLIGLHFGYKQEILDLVQSLKFLDQNIEFWFAFSEKQICIEKSQIEMDIQLSSIQKQYHIPKNNNSVFPHLFSIEDNIKLNNIQMIAKFNKKDWNYEILSLNYLGECISDFFVCEQFYEAENNQMRMKGKLKSQDKITFEITGSQNKKQLIIEEIELPNLFFDQLIKQFFGERFIEQIEYDMNQQYKIEISEFYINNNLELELELKIEDH